MQHHFGWMIAAKLLSANVPQKGPISAEILYVSCPTVSFAESISSRHAGKGAEAGGEPPHLSVRDCKAHADSFAGIALQGLCDASRVPGSPCTPLYLESRIKYRPVLGVEVPTIAAQIQLPVDQVMSTPNRNSSSIPGAAMLQSQFVYEGSELTFARNRRNSVRDCNLCVASARGFFVHCKRAKSYLYCLHFVTFLRFIRLCRNHLLNHIKHTLRNLQGFQPYAKILLKKHGTRKEPKIAQP